MATRLKIGEEVKPGGDCHSTEKFRFAGAATITLYSLQMGFAHYRQAITDRIAIRTGEAPLAEHFDVMRRQMLLAWPRGLLVVLAAMLVVVVAWCVVALVRDRNSDATALSIATLVVLALGIGPTFIFQYRAVSYVSIHWWFSGTWVVGWTATVCAFMALLQRFMRSQRRWYPALLK